MCVCVFLFVSFHGENRVKRVKKTSGGGAYFLHIVCFFTFLVKCIRMYIFSQIWSEKIKRSAWTFVFVNFAASAVCARWFEKNNFALFFAFSHDAGRPGAFPNTFSFVLSLPKNGSECVSVLFVFVYRVQSLDDFCFRLMSALLSRSKAPNIYTIN